MVREQKTQNNNQDLTSEPDTLLYIAKTVGNAHDADENDPSIMNQHGIF